MLAIVVFIYKFTELKYIATLFYFCFFFFFWAENHHAGQDVLIHADPE
jgi:hypothetical protein